MGLVGCVGERKGIKVYVGIAMGERLCFSLIVFGDCFLTAFWCLGCCVFDLTSLSDTFQYCDQTGKHTSFTFQRLVQNTAFTPAITLHFERPLCYLKRPVYKSLSSILLSYTSNHLTYRNLVIQ